MSYKSKKRVSVHHGGTQGHTNSVSKFFVLIDEDNDTSKETNVGLKTHVASRQLTLKTRNLELYLFGSLCSKKCDLGTLMLLQLLVQMTLKPSSPLFYHL